MLDAIERRDSATVAALLDAGAPVEGSAWRRGLLVRVRPSILKMSAAAGARMPSEIATFLE